MNKLTCAASPQLITVDEETTVSATVKNGEFLIDPADLSILVTDPDGAENTYLWPSDDVSHDGTGLFSVQFPATVSGKWSALVESTSVVGTCSTTWRVQPLDESVAINVLDADDNPIIDVSVSITTPSGSIAAGGVVDSTGSFYAKVKPGTYGVTAYKKKTSFDPNGSLVVNNTSGIALQSYTIRGTPLLITTASGVSRVRVFGQVFGSDGRLAAGVRVRLETLSFSNPQTMTTPLTPITGVDPSNAALLRETRELITGADGVWETDLVADSLVQCEIPTVGYKKTFRVPPVGQTLQFNVRDVADVTPSER